METAGHAVLGCVDSVDSATGPHYSCSSTTSSSEASCACMSSRSQRGHRGQRSAVDLESIANVGDITQRKTVLCNENLLCDGFLF